MSGARIFVARTAFACAEFGVIQRGTTVREGHPILRGREHMFTLQSVDFDIEQATAAPGERRSVTVPRARKPKE